VPHERQRSRLLPTPLRVRSMAPTRPSQAATRKDSENLLEEGSPDPPRFRGPYFSVVRTFLGVRAPETPCNFSPVAESGTPRGSSRPGRVGTEARCRVCVRGFAVLCSSGGGHRALLDRYRRVAWTPAADYNASARTPIGCPSRQRSRWRAHESPQLCPHARHLFRRGPAKSKKTERFQ